MEVNEIPETSYPTGILSKYEKEEIKWKSLAR